MIREYVEADIPRMVEIANDFTVDSPNWYPAPLPEDNRPFTIDQFPIDPEHGWGFVKMVDGVLVGYITGVVANHRGEIRIVVCDPVYPVEQRLGWFWELMQEAGVHCKQLGCTHMQGTLSATHQPILDIFSCWNSLGVDRKFQDTASGGVVMIDPDIETYLADCLVKVG